MQILKTVGIKEFKNKLSYYLRELGQGQRLLITDRDRVVAELVEPSGAILTDDNNPLLRQYISEGKIIPPRAPKKKLERSGIKLPKGEALRLLDELRSEEGRLP